MTPVTISRRKLLIAGGVSLLGLPAFGQDKYPSKAIRMVVPHPVGGGVDIIARNLGEHMRPRSASLSWWRTSPARTA